jgi:phenylacetate-CoA ligase
VRCELQPLVAQATAESEVREIAGWVQHRIKTMVGITTQVSVLAPDSIERTLVGKARRVVDKRSK